jgi:ribosomal protein S24E
MAKRQVFFSFEYAKDNWRASEVRNMGKVDTSSTFSDNDWEKVRRKTDSSIKKWIDDQLAMRSCLVVLIGASTSSRKWIKYEIEQAYKLKKGIVGIYIYGLENRYGNQTTKGPNPFYDLTTDYGCRLSSYVDCYDSPHLSSKHVYDDIRENIEDLIETAIKKAGTY